MYWGQVLTGSIVLNRGDTAVERFFVVRFQAESLEDGSVIQMHSENVNGLASGGDTQLALTIPINRRLARGEYRITAHVDPTNSSDDVNEANNCRAATGVFDLGGEPDVDG